MNHYAFLARILDYPDKGLAAALKESIAESQLISPQAAKLLGRFSVECERLGLDRLEETYANTFDLQADCSLYAGHHLFGEDWRRSLFLAELKERYQACGFSCGNEVPDHLGALLRFLSVQLDPEEERVLLEDCVLPVASKIAARLDPALNPYRVALDALLLRLGGQRGQGGASDKNIAQPQEAVP